MLNINLILGGKLGRQLLDLGSGEIKLQGDQDILQVLRLNVATVTQVKVGRTQKKVFVLGHHHLERKDLFNKEMISSNKPFLFPQPSQHLPPSSHQLSPPHQEQLKPPPPPPWLMTLPPYHPSFPLCPSSLPFSPSSPPLVSQGQPMYEKSGVWHI